MRVRPYFRRSIFRFLSLKTLANFMILGGLFWLFYTISPIIKAEVGYFWSKYNPRRAQAVAQYQGGFSEILEIAPPLPDHPVNTQASLMIPVINVNAPIVMDVSVVDRNKYFEALKSGVAHAEGTASPNEAEGNVYLFAHSTLNPSEIEQYSAVFTLLHRLEVGQRVTLFYKNKRYDYLVESKEVVSGFNTEPLTRQPDEPILTLQTCDPPGIPINRLIVTAKRVAVYDI